MHPPSLPILPPGNIPGNQFFGGRLGRPIGHRAAGRFMSMTPSEIEPIEPTTFRLVAQYLELLCRRVSQNSRRNPKNAYKILVGMRERKRQLGTPGHSREFNIEIASLVIRGGNINLIKQN